MQGTNRIEEGGEEHALCDPGSELLTTRREREKKKGHPPPLDKHVGFLTVQQQKQTKGGTFNSCES